MGGSLEVKSAVICKGKNRNKIETETVDIGFMDPIAEAIDDQLPHHWMRGAQIVFASAVVNVAAHVIWVEHVVGAVVDPPVAISRPVAAAFRGMIVDDIENDFDAGLVQGFDHGTKFVQRTTRFSIAAILRMRRKKFRVL